MIIIMKGSASLREKTAVISWVEEHDCKANIFEGVEHMVIGVIGDGRPLNKEQARMMPGVERVVPVLKPFKVASREFKPANTHFPLGDCDIGGDDFVIMARTDALAVEGLERAVERAIACVEAGADMIFPEAVTDLAMYRQFAAAVGVPVLANITEFGSTPLFTTEELAGADVSLALYPLSAFRAMNQAALKVYRAIREEGTQKSVLELMQSRMELYDYLGYHDYERNLDELFAKENVSIHHRGTEGTEGTEI